MSHRTTSPLVLVELAVLAAVVLWLLAGIASNPAVLALVCFVGAVHCCSSCCHRSWPEPRTVTTESVFGSPVGAAAESVKRISVEKPTEAYFS